jgi:MFS family permease
VSVIRPARRRISPLAAARALPDEFPRVVLVLATGDLVASFGFSLFFPFLTIYLVQTLHSSAAEAGLVIAAYSLFSIGSGIAGGWLSDRVGRRPVLIGSISCTAVLVVSMALATEAWHIGLVMLLLGGIDPAFLPAARAAVADTVAEAERPRAFGLLGVANAVGWIAGPVIGAGLSSLGYPLLFGVSGVLVGSYVVIAVRWLPETRPRGSSGLALPEPALAGSGAGTALDVGTGTPVALDETADAGRRVRIFAAFLPLLALAHATTFLWVTTLPIYAAIGLGLATPVWGLLFGLNGLLIVLFQLRISTACERRSKPRVMALALGFYAVALSVVALLSSSTAVAGLALVIALVTVGEMLLMPIVAAFVSDLSPAARRGTYQGVALAAVSVGSGLGPPIAGHVLDTAPGPVLWLGAAAILAIVGLLLAALGRWTDRLVPMTAGPGLPGA